MEEVGKLQAKLKELKQSKETAFEAKAMLEDELQSLNHKIVLLSKIIMTLCMLKSVLFLLCQIIFCF